jgi:paired amphipathic helix protein Sin3a
MISEETRGSKRKMEAASSSSNPPRRKRRSERDKEKEREREREKELERDRRERARERDAPSSRSRVSSHVSGLSAMTLNFDQAKRPAPPDSMKQVQPPPAQSEDRQFFDRVKRMLDSRDTYNEFLKIVNLFTQGYINTARLVRESRNFLGDSELMAQWYDILGWDVVKEADSWGVERQKAQAVTRPIRVGSKNRPIHKDLDNVYGSYRRLPPHVSLF